MQMLDFYAEWIMQEEYGTVSSHQHQCCDKWISDIFNSTYISWAQAISQWAAPRHGCTYQARDKIHNYVPCRILACCGLPITLANTRQTIGFLIWTALLNLIASWNVLATFGSKWVNSMHIMKMFHFYTCFDTAPWSKHCLASCLSIQSGKFNSSVITL